MSEEYKKQVAAVASAWKFAAEESFRLAMKMSDLSRMIGVEPGNVQRYNETMEAGNYAKIEAERLGEL